MYKLNFLKRSRKKSLLVFIVCFQFSISFVFSQTQNGLSVEPENLSFNEGKEEYSFDIINNLEKDLNVEIESENGINISSDKKDGHILPEGEKENIVVTVESMGNQEEKGIVVNYKGVLEIDDKWNKEKVKIERTFGLDEGKKALLDNFLEKVKEKYENDYRKYDDLKKRISSTIDRIEKSDSLSVKKKKFYKKALNYLKAKIGGEIGKIEKENKIGDIENVVGDIGNVEELKKIKVSDDSYRLIVPRGRYYSYIPEKIKSFGGNVTIKTYSGGERLSEGIESENSNVYMIENYSHDPKRVTIQIGEKKNVDLAAGYNLKGYERQCEFETDVARCEGSKIARRKEGKNYILGVEDEGYQKGYQIKDRDVFWLECEGISEVENKCSEEVGSEAGKESDAEDEEEEGPTQGVDDFDWKYGTEDMYEDLKQEEDIGEDVSRAEVEKKAQEVYNEGFEDVSLDKLQNPQGSYWDDYLGSVFSGLRKYVSDKKEESDENDGEVEGFLVKPIKLIFNDEKKKYRFYVLNRAEKDLIIEFEVDEGIILEEKYRENFVLTGGAGLNSEKINFVLKDMGNEIGKEIKVKLVEEGVVKELKIKRDFGLEKEIKELLDEFVEKVRKKYKNDNERYIGLQDRIDSTIERIADRSEVYVKKKEFYEKALNYVKVKIEKIKENL